MTWSEQVRKWHERGDSQTLEHKREYIIYPCGKPDSELYVHMTLLTYLPPSNGYRRHRRDEKTITPDFFALKINTWLQNGDCKTVIAYAANQDDIRNDIDNINNFPRIIATRGTVEVLGQNEEQGKSKLLLEIQEHIIQMRAKAEQQRK